MFLYCKQLLNTESCTLSQVGLLLVTRVNCRTKSDLQSLTAISHRTNLFFIFQAICLLGNHTDLHDSKSCTWKKWLQCVCPYFVLTCVHTSDLYITEGASLFELEDLVALLVFVSGICSFQDECDLILIFLWFPEHRYIDRLSCFSYLVKCSTALYCEQHCRIF